MTIRSVLAAFLLLATDAAAQTPPSAPSPAEIAAAAPSDDWADISPGDLLTLTLGDGRPVTIQLVKGFSPVHVANVRKLAAAGWWDGATVNRVQENYVVQWGDATERKQPPADLAVATAADYERRLAGLAFRPLGYPDAYARNTGHVDGWPVATDGRSAWLVHCFGMIGVGRGLAPDTGSGVELYVVNGHAPRHLDRNIALVGRVIDGVEALTSLKRGTGALGFYERAEERVPISSLHAGSPARWQFLKTSSASFARYVAARANRRDPFFNRPAGGVDICNAPAPIRRAP